MGRVGRAGGVARPHRRGGGADQRLPGRARANRLHVQGVRAGAGRFPRQARRQGNVLVLEAGRRENRALARDRGGLRGPPTHTGNGRRGGMRGFWLLVHVLGFALWLGGGIATMVAGVTAKRMGMAERLAAYKLIGAVQRMLVAPGAIAVVLSGFILARPYMESGQVPGWLGTMMGAGLLGAIGAVAISVPTAAKLARLEPGPGGRLPEAFQRLRKRQILAASIAGALGLVAMFAVTLGRG